MKILLLGPYKEHLVNYLLSFGDKVIHFDDEVQPSQFIEGNFDFIISYGYRYIIPSHVVSFYEGKLINLHISYLPWNRGADPNLWSFLDDTPKGVTIHYIDEGLDTGDIIVQEKMFFSKNETLSSSYLKLALEIENLLVRVWPLIRIGKNKRSRQLGKGSYHRSVDKNAYLHLLTDGWDTPISFLIQGTKRGENNE